MMYLTKITSSYPLPFRPRITRRECRTSATYRRVDMMTSNLLSPWRKRSSILPTAVPRFGCAMTRTDLPLASNSSFRMPATVLLPDPSIPSTTYHAMISEPQQHHGR